MINIGDVNTKVYIGDTEAKVYIGDELIYPSTIDWSTRHLTMTVVSGGTIDWIKGASATEKVIEYSKDNGANWTSITSTTQGTQIQVSAGDVVIFRGNNSGYQQSGQDASAYRNGFQITSSTVVAAGNIMSMVNGDNFIGTTFSTFHAFANFFFKCSGLQDVQNIVLPSSTTTCCYLQMFYSCTTITTSPMLTAQTLNTQCYRSMFQNCVNLNYIKCTGN